ncbi:LAMI_0E01970g1_1 [Lachancea mirantina]|uniref:LAMI_0E01970g1_1 n=1 Tax=Lachancea mirantina TaxID=1230905 RepID=A0A1G4JJ36_9SACH|nr:LAMI_0E01970g1_1 [Lachancea mirantina]
MTEVETSSQVQVTEPEVNNSETVPRTVVDPETTIFIGNVARDCTEEDLKSVFGDEVEVEIPSTKSGRFFKQRYAFVKYPSKIDFDAIREKHDRTVVKERGIYIRRAQTQEERDAKRTARASQQQQKKGETAHRVARKSVPAPPQKPERTKAPLETMERSKDTLYVNNVPYHATKEQIAEFFSTQPELVVLPLRRMRDVKTKKFFFSKKMNRGIAFVTFENCTDIAAKVDEFKGKKFNDRELAVDVAALKPDRSNDKEQTEESPALADDKPVATDSEQVSA